MGYKDLNSIPKRGTSHRWLTGRSSGRQHGPWLRYFYGPCWCPALASLLPAPLTLGVMHEYLTNLAGKIMDKFTELVEQLLMASHSSSNDCSQKVTDLLVENLPIKAATFYSYFYKTELLTLRAQCGFEYKDYASFELPLLSIAGSAVTTGTTVREGGLLESKHYRDKNIVKKYNLTDIICIPIKSSTCIETYGQNICQDISGVICLYPNNNNESHFSDELLTKLSDLVGKTYDFSVLTDRMLIRADIVQSSITSKDLNSFLHKVLHLMTKKWWLEASSVFINGHLE